jgi:hypothetical protein
MIETDHAGMDGHGQQLAFMIFLITSHGYRTPLPTSQSKWYRAMVKSQPRSQMRKLPRRSCTLTENKTNEVQETG